MASLKGITIEIGGETTGLEKALKKVNSSISETTRSLKDINKATKLDPGNADMVAQRQRNLAQAVQATQEKYNLLQNAVSQANSALASGQINISQYEALERELSMCSSQLNSFKSQLRSVGSTNASAQITAFGQSLQSVGGSISSVGAMLMPFSVAFGAAGAAAIKLASDSEEASSKVDAVFGSAAGSVHEFASEAVSSMGMTSAQAEAAAGTFGGMAVSMGIPAQAAAEMSMQLVQLAADMASFNNVDIESSANALRGVFTGEGEALKNLGIVMNNTELQAYTLSAGFKKSYDEMSSGEQAVARYGYIMEKTGAQQGDFARTSQGTANSAKTLKAALAEAGSKIGSDFQPAVTAVINALSGLVQAFSSMPKPIRMGITAIMAIVAAFGPFLLIIGGVITAIGNFATALPVAAGAINSLIPALAKFGAVMATVAPEILAAIAIVAALGAIIYVVASNWDSIAAAVSSAMDSIKTSIANSKIGQEFTKDLETVKQNVSTILGDMQSAFEQGGGGIKGAVMAIGAGISSYFSIAFGTVKNIARDAMEGVQSAISSAMDAAKSAASRGAEGVKNAIGKIGEIADNIGDAIKNLPSKIQQAMQEMAASIKDSFESLSEKASKWGTDLVDNFTNGINGSKNKLIGAVNDLASTVSDTLGFSEPEIGPLSDFHTYAPDMIDLWVKGVRDNLGKVQEASNLMAMTMSPSNSLQSIAQSSADRTTSSINALAQNVGAMNKNTTVQVVLEGDAKGVFKLVRQENMRMVQSTGFHALA